MSHSPDLDLTAVVVCRDDEDCVGHLVRRLSEHLRALHLDAEILAVDEFSGDNTLVLLGLLRRELPELRVVPGVAPGRGFVRGAQMARGRAVVLLDARSETPLAPLGFALGRIAAGWDALAIKDRYLVLRRARTFDTFDALLHRRDPGQLERRFLRRARALGLRVECAGGIGQRPTPWDRLRDAILVPLASRAW